MVACCKKFGGKISFNRFDVYYTNGVTQEDARKLGEYFQGLGLNDMDEDRECVQVQKLADTYLVKFVVVDGAESDQEIIESFEFMGYILSALVYEGIPVDIHLCEYSFNTRKELRFA